MKVSLTEEQLRSFNNRLIYEGILDDMVFKISLIVEDGKTEPDMEWDFTNVKKDIDKSKLWVKTKEDAIQYVESVVDKIKNIPPELRKKILKYVIYSFIGLLSIKQLNKMVEPVVKKADQIEKETIEKIISLRIRKSSPELYEHIRYEEGSITKKGEPVLVAYNLGDGAYTIGYGHAIFRGENEGYEFLPNYNKIIPGRTKITKDQAEILLKDDISNSEAIINKILNKWETEGIKIKVSQGMYNAMVSMAYNMGPGIAKSDFIKALKSGNTYLAAEQILKTSSNLFKKFPGLEPRRMREYKMFTS
jgi:GH24 family phage-related lysozyme (muramidase)